MSSAAEVGWHSFGTPSLLITDNETIGVELLDCDALIGTAGEPNGKGRAIKGPRPPRQPSTVVRPRRMLQDFAGCVELQDPSATRTRNRDMRRTVYAPLALTLVLILFVRMPPSAEQTL